MRGRSPGSGISPWAGRCAARCGLLGVVAGAALAASGCGTPEGNVSRYQAEALGTLRAAQSSAQAVLITLDLRLSDRTFGRAADDAVTGAEGSLSSTAGTFEALQPPRGADAVREQATSLLSRAEDAVAAARIAIRRDDRTAMRAARNDLATAVDDLDHAPDALS